MATSLVLSRLVAVTRKSLVYSKASSYTSRIGYREACAWLVWCVVRATTLVYRWKHGTWYMDSRPRRGPMTEVAGSKRISYAKAAL